MVAGTGSVGLQVLLLVGTLGASALQVLLSGEKLVMEHYMDNVSSRAGQ